MRQFWTTPSYVFGLGAACGILGMLAAAGVSLPDRPWPVARIEPSVQTGDRVPDALGASLARSLAEAGQRALRNAANPAGRTACEAAIAAADSAAFRAAEDARSRQRNAQSLPMVLAAEDLYLAAARLCLREAGPVCQSSNPRRIDGCDQVLAVREAELVSTRALRASRGN